MRCGFNGFVAQIRLRREFPFPLTDSSYRNGFRNAKCGVAIENGGTNL
ncbi:MAG: hypothetical protein ACI9BH_001999, partial [Paracoccaceae bacterium]